MLSEEDDEDHEKNLKNTIIEKAAIDSVRKKRLATGRQFRG